MKERWSVCIWKIDGGDGIQVWSGILIHAET